MSENKQHHGLWDLGTQPLLLILSNNDVKSLNIRWNLCLLRKENDIPYKDAYIYHWNGPCKYNSQCINNYC